MYQMNFEFEELKKHHKKHHKEEEELKQIMTELLETLEMCERLFKEALPKFNWKSSALDANAIQLLNETEIKIKNVVQLKSKIT